MAGKGVEVEQIPSKMPDRAETTISRPIFDYSVKRADPAELKRIFMKYASVHQSGESFMTPANFIRDFLGMVRYTDYNKKTVDLLAGVVDQTKDGLISFDELSAYEAHLCSPDAVYKVAFQLFDLDGKGSVSFDEFESVMKNTRMYRKIEFDFNTEFVKLHFGVDKKRRVPYQEFGQLLQDLHLEYLRQAFFSSDVVDGTITAIAFHRIMKTIRGHMLSPYVRENLLGVAGGETSQRVSFAYFRAFNCLLDNLKTIENIFTVIAKGDHFRKVTREEFLHTAKDYQQVTPIEIEILFNLCDPEHSTGRIQLSDIQKIVPKIDPFRLYSVQTQKEEFIEPDQVVEMSVQMQALESIYRFSLGSVAGAVGCTFVYPIDLVKTRLQNQRSVLVGEIMYRNSFDCFLKVIKYEGPFAIYRGLIPQLVGVSPEKAIKLTTNDFVRGKLADANGYIPLWGQIFAGGAAGASQVMFTNPIEIVKIRLQTAGEDRIAGSRVTGLSVCRELGFAGLYKGARACFMRDIPFSAIYFPAYSYLKQVLADENGHNGPLSLLMAASGAGVPAASLTTPADVIKTRLQVKAQRGQQIYRGVVDCVRKVWAEEGGKAFWKGAPARVFRSSPQFGVTLLTYELLQRALYVDFGRGAKSEMMPQNPDVSLNVDHIGGLRMAVSTFAGVESRFGLVLPKFEYKTTPNRPTSAPTK